MRCLLAASAILLPLSAVSTEVTAPSPGEAGGVQAIDDESPSTAGVSTPPTPLPPVAPPTAPPLVTAAPLTAPPPPVTVAPPTVSAGASSAAASTAAPPTAPVTIAPPTAPPPPAAPATVAPPVTPTAAPVATVAPPGFLAGGIGGTTTTTTTTVTTTFNPLLTFLDGRKCGVVASSRNEGKGPGITPEMLLNAQQAGMAWHTNWGTDIPVGFQPTDYGYAKLVPQQWGLEVKPVQVRNPIAPILLGPNEPDQTDMGGSGLEVAKVLGAWMQGVQAAREKGYQEFVAPSIAKALPSRYTYKAGGTEWLPMFLDGCLDIPGCNGTVDYLGFHMYEPECTSDVEKAVDWNMGVRVASLKRIMDDYNARGMDIKGLWLTEFAGRSDERGLCKTAAEQKGWMEAIVPLLEAEPAIIAYSWFSYGHGRSSYFYDNANLFNYETGELNDLGRTYFRLCTEGHEFVAAPLPRAPWVFYFKAAVVLCTVGALILAGYTFCGPRIRRRRQGWLDHAEDADFSCLSCDGDFRRLRRGDSSPNSSFSSEDEDEDSTHEYKPRRKRAGSSPTAEEPMLQKLPLNLQGIIGSVNNCVASSGRFDREGEQTFAQLLPFLQQWPASGGEGQVSLADIPYRHEIWTFLFQIGEKRPALRPQAKEVALKLEESGPWLQTMKRDIVLQQRRAELMGST